ncbi:hypothetical protein CHARACLAT_031428 [Characodon lateralis]|uniref:Uncharacterized protein n=1 Tax=Characodon lateralis TaxID=208331 RepID=A0ABU7D281_9TELE|nr:hypothetical protein [Characodon lateralis]
MEGCPPDSCVALAADSSLQSLAEPAQVLVVSGCIFSSLLHCFQQRPGIVIHVSRIYVFYFRMVLPWDTFREADFHQTRLILDYFSEFGILKLEKGFQTKFVAL